MESCSCFSFSEICCSSSRLSCLVTSEADEEEDGVGKTGDVESAAASLALVGEDKECCGGVELMLGLGEDKSRDDAN